MKKLLSVLATIGVVSSSATSAVACGTKPENKPENKPEEPKKDITQIVQDFEQDVIKIWTEHYEKQVVSNLIGVESMEVQNEFLNKFNIQKFSKPEWKDKLTSQNKQQLTNDVEKLFKVKLLEEKLNDFKKINKYKIILDEVESVFEHVELVFNDNFQINSGEIVSGTYIGNVIVDYKIVTQYKGVSDIEKFKQSGTLKYTSTESESFKKVGDEMNKNIAKDMFISEETQKYVNLKWSDIKGYKDDSDAYATSNSQLKKYYNEKNDFHEALLETINNKYFKKQFPTMKIKYDKKSIYKTEDFAQSNKNYLIINNLYKSDDDIVTFDLSKLEEKNKVDKIFLADENELNNFLLNDQFTALKWSKVRNSYKNIQDSFLDSFLTKSEISEYQKTNSYKLAIAIGNVEFVGPSIKIGTGEESYAHQLPDFKLAISYSMNGINDENYKTLADFSLKLFNVYKNIYDPIKKRPDYFYFNMNFNPNYIQKRVWTIVNKKDEFSLTGTKINQRLVDFSQFYFKNKKSNLNLININENTFKEKDIYFSINFYNENIINPKISINNTGLNWSFIRLTDTVNIKVFDNLNSMTLNLFGILKLKVKFDKNYSANDDFFWLF
ncbi:lipoprotein [Spiroplasma floricola]|uniref:Lipoprotein n=1 Tax=Spiroplasma floricola 23-6 TaxID=1336749 RepID=A0A2K8SE67_9MOLU|nr:lipoprotein [Spiroplasma floricola]AUB31751.1 hypothetical protein SFLOR_v1c07030 [Spiroplasma floricola 23-6]